MPKEELKDESKTVKQPIMSPKLGLGLAAILAVVLIFLAGMAADRVNNPHRPMMAKFAGGFSRFGGMGGRRGFGGGFSSNQNRISGVVTSVNGDNFTVAGNGSTNTVVTNSSTQYSNGSKVA